MPKSVMIERGMGSRAIAQTLANEGIISSPYPFLLQTRLLQRGITLKAGEYAFEPRLSMLQVIEKMHRGDVVVHNMTIPEGWTTREAQEALAREPLLVGAVPAAKEGSILPETYQFERGEERGAVLARMQKAQQTLLSSLWQNRSTNLAIQTPEQALILASIVEKETGRHGERERIAAVFHNRLRQGMMLQADPTVIYAVTKGRYKLERPISKTDLTTPDAYNTYTVAGLPPTPICNPGKAALQATLNPASTNDMYFVADPEGHHQFSNNLEQHNQYVKALRASERTSEAANNPAPIPTKPAVKTAKKKASSKKSTKPSRKKKSKS